MSSATPPSHHSDESIARLAEQQAYYDARAAEYDEWWERRGRYDRGAEHAARWQAEVADVEAGLASLGPLGDVWDLASGTGTWSRAAIPRPGTTRLVAVDGAAEMLAVHRQRTEALAAESAVPYETRQIDLFTWEPSPAETGVADTILLGFFLSHVPRDQMARLWTRVIGRLLKPTGRVFLIDSQAAPTSRATNHPEPDIAAETAERILNDGRRFTIIKRFHEPTALRDELASLGFTADLLLTDEFFLYGSVRRSADFVAPDSGPIPSS